MLRVDDLAYQYDTHQVLAGVSFTLDPQQISLLVGQNGAGKSTLLRCIAGWTRILDGAISLNGISCRKEDKAYRQQVIFVPDTPAFYDELTAWEHLQLIAQLHHIPGWQDTSEALLRQFQLWDARGSFPFTFSRGMGYKLALCMALLVRPPFLLLDEPFGPLDALMSQTLWQILSRYALDGGLVLFSSHTIPAGAHPDILLHLHGGQVETVQPDANLNLVELLNHVD